MSLQTPKFYLAVALLLFCSITLQSFAQQQYPPLRYYTFDDPQPGEDRANNSDLDFQYYGSGYQINNGSPVGQCLTMGHTGSLVKGGNIDLDDEMSIEFLFKPGHTFNNTEFIRRRDKGFEIAFDFPDQTRLYARIKFRTKYKDNNNNIVDDMMVVEMDGLGLKDWGYYADGNWHHLVFTFNATTGTKQIWVDGMLAPDFIKSVPQGQMEALGTPTELWFNNITDYRRLFGSIDEFAIYDAVLPPSLIYKHYLGIQQGNHYSWVDDYTGPIPTPGPTVAGIDPEEYAPGHPNVNVNARTQLYNFPGPRYKKGHTLIRNFQWFDPGKLAGYHTSNYSATQIRHNMIAIQKELAKNYNYFLLASGNTIDNDRYNDTLSLPGASVKLANDNPQWGASAITFWPQINPTHAGYPDQNAYIQSQGLPSNNYLRDSSGQYMSKWGGNTTSKFWSPAAPLTYTHRDGETQRYYMQKLLDALTRPLDIVNENSEIIPLYPESTLEKDPAIQQAKQNSGKDWSKYQGWAKKRVSRAYSDTFMNLPGLGNTKFTEYGIDGQPTWRHDYSEARMCNDQINGQYYPTGDFYPRWPQNWRYWAAAWHGWQWIADSRKNELAVGDKLFSPFVGAGWNNDPERNLRPAQWLALLKSLNTAGAEFFYTCFFAEVTPYQNPDHWVWQVVMPSYAQAVTSRYENLLRDGYILEGDVPSKADFPNGDKNYSFYSGDFRKLVNVRKHDNANKYVITASIQPNSNMMGNIEAESEATITLDGMNLQFKVRKQGSVYYYDRTNPSAPVFYQLDGWHEYKHPSRWSKDFAFEGELFDNSNSNLIVKTDLPSGAGAGDFREFDSYLSFQNTSSSPVAEYDFIVRDNNPTYYFWVRARSSDGSSTGLDVKLDNGSVRSVGCIDQSSWKWYRFDACNQQAISYSNVSKSQHTLTIIPINDKIEIDKILLTKDANLILNTDGPNCSSTQASISASGSTTFCTGDSVVLTASQGSSYLWMPGGETSRSIVVKNSGNFSVIVGQGTGCSASAPNQTVTVTSSVPVSITTSGPTSFCNNGSVTLTASLSTTYLWSPGGQTTRSIVINSPGNYSVLVSNADGCTGLDQINVVDQSAIQNALVKNDVSCYGASDGEFLNVVSGGSSPYSYLWNDGSTAANRSNLSKGAWTVTITDNSGCTAKFSEWINAPARIRVNSSVIPASCFEANDGSFIPSVAGGVGPFSYLWNDGNAASNRSNLGRGVWTVTVTDANGCTNVNTQWVGSPSRVKINTGTISPASCFTSADGVVTKSQSGGTPPYSHLWSDGNTSPNRYDLSRGTWTVTVTDGNGCSVVKSQWINSPPKLNFAAVTVNNASCYGANDGVFTTSASGGSPSYTYLWSNGSTLANRYNLARGTHVVTLTDSRGCAETISQWIDHPPQIFADIIATGPTSQGGSDGSAGLVNISNAVNPVSYLWSTGHVTQSVSGLNTGTYTVTITDANNCELEKSFYISHTSSTRSAELFQEIELNVFPNPNDGLFTLGIHSPMDEKQAVITLYNMLGEAIWTKEMAILVGKTQLLISIEDLNPGVYFLNFKSDQADRSLRIVKL